MNNLPENLRADYEFDLKRMPIDRFSHPCIQYEDVLRAHYLICDYFQSNEGISSLHGVKDVNLLCSAVARQDVGFCGETKWKDGFEIAATLFLGLIKNHAFLRGNHVVNGTVVRRSMFAKILPYRKEAPLEDYWSHLQLSKRARYICVQHHTFRYRWHESNTMRNTSHIDDMWRRTLCWEEANLVRQKDWTHLRQYLSARAEKLSERRLFCGVLSAAWYSTPFSALRLLNVFGRTIRARRVLRNGRA